MDKRICNHIDDVMFEGVWFLYNLSFPEEQKRTLSKHLEVCDDNRFHPVIYTEGTTLMALSFYWKFNNFLYLEHLAVTPEARNRRVGTVVLSQLVKQGLPVILEIEPPVDDVSRNRLCFYMNNRFMQTGYIFRQLKYRKASSDLMLELLSNKLMNETLYEDFSQTIYKELNIYCE